MKMIKAIYKNRRKDILVFLGISFNLLAILTIILYFSKYASEDMFKVLVLLIPIASPIVLYFALKQSMKSNDIQNSLIFFNGEKENIEALMQLGNENHYKKLVNIIGEYRIPLKKDVTFLNISESFVPLHKHLVGNQERFIEIANNWKSHQKECIAFDKYFEFRNGYYYFLNKVRQEVDNINNLYNSKSLVKPHRDLLFRMMYRLVQDFYNYVQYYQSDSSNIENANAPIMRAPQSYTLEPLFQFDYTDQKYNKLLFLKDYGYNVIE